MKITGIQANIDFWTGSAGLVIYWTWNNTLTVAQQSLIMHRAGVKNELFGNVARMFSRKPAATAAAAPAKIQPAKTTAAKTTSAKTPTAKT